jgi:hypothetical protein
LRQGETDEHADGEQRDEGIGVAGDRDEQSGGHDGQHPNTVTEY